MSDKSGLNIQTTDTPRWAEVLEQFHAGKSEPSLADIASGSVHIVQRYAASVAMIRWLLDELNPPLPPFYPCRRWLQWGRRVVMIANSEPREDRDRKRVIKVLTYLLEKAEDTADAELPAGQVICWDALTLERF